MTSMKLHIVPRLDVEHTAKADSQPELGLQPKHNSHSHKLEEVQAVLPHTTHLPPASQPWILLDSFVDLIAESQGLDRADVHSITLPSRFLTMAEQYGTSGVLLQTLSSSALEDLEETFSRTTNEGRAIGELFARSSMGKDKKFFARISTCSFKDSVFQPGKTGSSTADRGSGPVIAIEQLWQRIATSGRALTGIKDLRAAGLPVNLFLFPWNDGIISQREYRVFCPPNRGEVAAVSQYSWFKPWINFRSGDGSVSKMREVAQSVLHGVLDVHRKLMAHPEIRCSSMKETGFTFDVVERPNGSMALLELNNFGAMSGCGSCLFHWIHDAEALYATREHCEIEFRVLAGG